MGYLESYSENAWKQIRENPIILDFEKVKNWNEMHAMFKKKFGFPDYYGENWSAFEDCLEDCFIGQGNYTVELHGFLTMDDDLAEDSQIMLEIFEAIHARTPNVTFALVS